MYKLDYDIGYFTTVVRARAESP